jgi:hypothetical protein
LSSLFQDCLVLDSRPCKQSVAVPLNAIVR